MLVNSSIKKFYIKIIIFSSLIVFI